jgi:N-acetylmuramoyl-L-alanine amidase
MRLSWAWTLALVLLAGAIQDGRCNLARLAPARAGFTPLWRWAKVNGFRQAGLKPDGQIKLTSKNASLWFKADSALAEINGVRVWLGQPAIVLDGQPWVSALDLRETIEPILFPRESGAITRICLDPGHGGKDTGGVVGGRAEKDLTLALAKELARQLKAAGFKVVLTRATDEFVELEHRAEVANGQRAGLFLSLHFNIGAPGEGKGVEVYCLTPPRSNSTNAGGQRANHGSLPGNRRDPQNVFLAYQLQKHLVKDLGAEDRGLRRARFEVLRSAKMPAVLIEGGFLSDSQDRARIANPKYRSRMARAIVQGIRAYLGGARPQLRLARQAL